MATKHHSTFPIGAAVSLLFALVIGSAPVAALLALASKMEALQ
jgi:hypothetical protein